MSFVTATLFLALAAQAFAQQPSSSGIEGAVLNATTGTPVRRAQIFLRRANPNGFTSAQTPGFAADTDSEGKFELAQVEPGSYTVEVRRSGFVTQHYKGQLSVSAGNRTKGFDFKLVPHAVVAGRILDQEGAPLLDMEVRLLRLFDMNGKQSLSPVGFAQTNDAGEFRIAGLAAGRYFLSASSQNYAQAFLLKLLRYDFDKPQMAFAKTFFPSSSDEAGARPIDLTSAQTLAGLELRMKQERVFRIRGKVLSSIPIKDLRIEAAPRNSDRAAPLENKEAILNEDGSFEIARLFPGSYFVTAMMNTGSRSVIGKTPVDITHENLNNVVINKLESVTISGTIRIEGSLQGKPPSLEEIQLNLASTNGTADGFRQAKSDALGAFEFENALEGKFRFVVQNLPAGVWLKSITAAGRSLLNTEIAIPVGPIEVTLAAGVGTISGIVSNSQGQPSPGFVILQGQQPRPDLSRSIATDQNGRFNFPNIAPGNYSLYPEPPFEASKPPSRESIEAARSKALRVTITPNSQNQIDLTLPGNP